MASHITGEQRCRNLTTMQPTHQTKTKVLGNYNNLQDIVMVSFHTYEANQPKKGEKKKNKELLDCF